MVSPIFSSLRGCQRLTCSLKKYSLVPSHFLQTAHLGGFWSTFLFSPQSFPPLHLRTALAQRNNVSVANSRTEHVTDQWLAWCARTSQGQRCLWDLPHLPFFLSFFACTSCTLPLPSFPSSWLPCPPAIPYLNLFHCFPSPSKWIQVGTEV